MISTAKCRVSSAKGFDYIQQKGKATELARNDLVGQTPQELNREFNQLAEYRPNLKNNQINIIISPDIAQRDFSNSELKEILDKHLKNMNLENHPYIATVHRNTKNPHIHCLIARIDRDNNVYKDNFISLRSQESAHKISQELGLTNPIEKNKLRKKEVATKIKQALKTSTSVNDLNKLLVKDRISIEPVYKTKNKEIQGYRVSIDDKSLKLSQIDRKLPQELTLQLEQNKLNMNPDISFNRERKGMKR